MASSIKTEINWIARRTYALLRDFPNNHPNIAKTAFNDILALLERHGVNINEKRETGNTPPDEHITEERKEELDQIQFDTEETLRQLGYNSVKAYSIACAIMKNVYKKEK